MSSSKSIHFNTGGYEFRFIETNKYTRGKRARIMLHATKVITDLVFAYTIGYVKVIAPVLYCYCYCYTCCVYFYCYCYCYCYCS